MVACDRALLPDGFGGKAHGGETRVIDRIKGIRQCRLLRKLGLPPRLCQTAIGTQEKVGLGGGTTSGQNQDQCFNQLIARRVRDCLDGKTDFLQRCE